MENSTGRGRPACGANSLSGSCVFIQLSKLIILKIDIFKIQPFKVLYLRASSYFGSSLFVGEREWQIFLN